MKNKKSMIIKITLAVLAVLIAIALMNQSYALIGAIAGTVGVGILIVWAGQAAAVGIALALKGIMAAVTGFMSGSNTAVTSMADVIFNRNGATTAGFFGNIGISPSIGTADVVTTICGEVEKWYYIVRNLSIAALLFILLYIGIRMAISTVADKEAKYKKMLTDWVVSLVLVFVLHYIMVITFYINNTLVSALYTVYTANAPSAWDWAGLLTSVLVPLEGLDEAIVFCSIVVSEFLFFIMYIKRFITLAFLMVIAPLITITYALDKLGDGKSQALNTWLKEFIFTVIIQPVHCILYLVLVIPVIKNVSGVNALGSGIFYIIMLNFIRNGETIVKKIFNIRADSMPDAGTTAALTFGVMSGLLGKLGKGAKSDDKTGRKMPNMADEAGLENAAGNVKKDEKKGTKDKTDVKETDKAQNAEKGTEKETGEAQSWGNDDEAAVAFVNPVEEAVEEAKGEGTGDETGDVTPIAVDLPAPETTDKKQKKEHFKALKSIGKDIKNSPHEFANTVRYLTNYDKGGMGAVAKTLAKKGLVAGGAIFGASAGLTLGDASKAIGLAAAGAAGTNKIESAISETQEGVTLRDNQRYFASAVNDYAYALQENSDKELSTAEIRQKAIELWQNYQDGGIDLDSDELSDYEREFLEKCEQMDDTYSYVGVDDSGAAVNRTIGMALTGEIEQHRNYQSRYEERVEREINDARRRNRRTSRPQQRQQQTTSEEDDNQPTFH